MVLTFWPKVSLSNGSNLELRFRLSKQKNGHYDYNPIHMFSKNYICFNLKTMNLSMWKNYLQQLHVYLLLTYATYFFIIDS
jgi:hypothetical protein